MSEMGASPPSRKISGEMLTDHCWEIYRALGSGRAGLEPRAELGGGGGQTWNH
jgi:hypothetical protein